MPGFTSLSSGILPRIMAGEDEDKPVLQILGTKKIQGGDTERLRLLISDGQYFNSYAMLATQLNSLHADGKLSEFTIIRIDKYISSVVNKNADAGKRVLIILELTVLHPGTEVKTKIGSPVSYTDASSVQNNKPSTSSTASKPLTANNNNNNNNIQKPDLKPLNKIGDTAHNRSIVGHLTHPISSLTPYNNKWVIKARVTSKSGIRTWSNARGEGKLFSMDLMDESGEIRATAFKDQCDKFHDMIEVDHVYFISKCQLKSANKQYSSLKNDYEMTFTNETMVQPCDETDSGIPEIRYNFVPISQISAIEPNAVVDAIGICKEAGELQTFTARTSNKEFKKREIVLVDTSNASINLTLWNDDAVNFEGHVQPVVLVKSGRVTEFNGGKSLGLGPSAVMKINPDIPEGHKLRGWFDNGGGENVSNSISTRTGGGGYSSEWLTFHEQRIRNLGNGDRPDYFQCKAVVHNVKTANAFYKACPQQDCNKKIVEEGNGQFRCERCNAVYPNFKYRLLLNMNVGDWTSNRWVTCFSDVGEQMLGRSAQEIGQALEEDVTSGEEMLNSINLNAYIFKLRVKAEMYGDVNRTKLTVQSASPINYKEYNRYLIKNLQELTGISKV